jgi:hypothetical protein
LEQPRKGRRKSGPNARKVVSRLPAGRLLLASRVRPGY